MLRFELLGALSSDRFWIKQAATIERVLLIVRVVFPARSRLTTASPSTPQRRAVGRPRKEVLVEAEAAGSTPGPRAAWARVPQCRERGHAESSGPQAQARQKAKQARMSEGTAASCSRPSSP